VRLEPRSECHICGLSFFESDMVKHYRTGRLVDAKCADEPSWSDYRARWKGPVEERRMADQPVGDDGVEAGFQGVGFGDFLFGDQPYGDP
jgi:hypothetical protein